MNILVTAALSVLLLPMSALAQNQAWVRQLGTTQVDCANAAAPDGSAGVFLGGDTNGSLGAPNAGGYDAWLARYDSGGNQIWTRQIGTSGGDGAAGAASDGSGGVFVGGHTQGSLAGQNAGAEDAWLARYDATGLQLWVRQFGTSGSEAVTAAAADGVGGVLVTGYTGGNLGGPTAGSGDAWVARYDGAGNQTWIRQLGSSALDEAYAAASDGSGGVHISGFTRGDLGGPPASGYDDVWLARYDSAGNQTWIRHLGSPYNDYAWAAAPDDSGGVFIGGFTEGSLGGPIAYWAHPDAWLAHYDAGGNMTWIRQLGGTWTDHLNAAAPDGSGGVYVGGRTDNGLWGPLNGLSDAWLARYDSAGSQAWIRQLGSSALEYAYAAAPDGSGGVHISGVTRGSLGGPIAGADDAWVAHYVVPCGTTTSYCTPATSTHGCVPTISGTGAPSASAGSGFTISVSNVEGAQSGLIFYGLSGAVAFPWGTSTSFMCVKSPLERTPVQNSGGTFGACDGLLSLDWNLYRASNPLSLGSPFVGGEQVRAQAWFRDPPSPKTTNLSNGLLFSVCP